MTRSALGSDPIAWIVLLTPSSTFGFSACYAQVWCSDGFEVREYEREFLLVVSHDEVLQKDWGVTGHRWHGPVHQTDNVSSAEFLGELGRDGPVVRVPRPVRRAGRRVRSSLFLPGQTGRVSAYEDDC